MKLRRYYLDTDPETGDVTTRRLHGSQKHDLYRRAGGPAPRKPTKAQRAQQKRQRLEREGPASELPPPTEPMGRKRRRSQRRQVVAEAGGCCQNCGSTRNLTIDHIVPRHIGGGNHLANLQCLCGRCNEAKGLGIWTPQTQQRFICP